MENKVTENELPKGASPIGKRTASTVVDKGGNGNFASELVDRDPTVGMYTLAQLEERYIRDVLDLTKGNKTKAAKVLGVSLKTIYNKLEEYAKRT